MYYKGEPVYEGDVVENVPMCNAGESKDCFRPLKHDECDALETEDIRAACRAFSK